MAQQNFADVQYDGKLFRYAMFSDGIWRYFDRERQKLRPFRHQELVRAVRWHSANTTTAQVRN